MGNVALNHVLSPEYVCRYAMIFPRTKPIIQQNGTLTLLLLLLVGQQLDSKTSMDVGRLSTIQGPP